VSVAAWHEEPIAKRHGRETFDCGEAALNEFLRRYARRNHELGGAKTFLAIDDAGSSVVLGFYSLSPASIDYARVPEIVRRGLARYDVPAFRLARLAVDRKVQGQRLGGQLLLAAGRRCLAVSEEVGGVAMLIDAKNARAAAWYAAFGAVPVLDSPLSLVLSLRTIAAALRAAGKY
jgi:GNAT superfamily N-acetyltransferase